MPLAKRVCFLPWQSRFIETQEFIVAVRKASKTIAKKNLFISTLKIKKDGQLVEQLKRRLCCFIVCCRG